MCKYNWLIKEKITRIFYSHREREGERERERERERKKKVKKGRIIKYHTR